ncbi:hypothetical protein AAKU61_001381 [Undibacterium sp. GrIS 1.2]|uniref:hypothetical protein n=1 Tax=unclassified Undibacterium TaxID=2630295 RepID=UPI003399B0F9
MRLSHYSLLLPLLSSAFLAAVPPTANAAPEEIQVYMDEINNPHEFGLDLHNNYVISGNGTPDYSGAQPPRHVFRLTPEFSYGLTKNWELGAYILTSRDAHGGSNVDGEKLRMKYLVDKDATSPFFYGANLEVGRVNQHIDQNPWNAELKGIFGYRKDRWTLAANANIDWKISGPAPSPTSLEIDSKIAYKTDQGFDIGVESYNEIGAVRHLGQLNQQSQTIYAVIDTSIKGWDLNLGIGRGLTTVSDRWLLKAIVSVPF